MPSFILAERGMKADWLGFSAANASRASKLPVLQAKATDLKKPRRAVFMERLGDFGNFETFAVFRFNVSVGFRRGEAFGLRIKIQRLPHTVRDIAKLTMHTGEMGIKW
jgi:hypothetical protein